MLKLGRPFDLEMELFQVVYMFYLVRVVYEDLCQSLQTHPSPFPLPLNIAEPETWLLHC